MKSGSLWANGLLCFFVVYALAVGAASIHYVNVNSTNPVSPYLDWSKAATKIQLAVSVATSGDSVFVADGIYYYNVVASQGEISTVRVDKNIQIQSVNGPGSTIIEGNSTGPLPLARCVELLSPCLLDGFTVRHGGLTNEPSGIRIMNWGAVVTNCIISDNKGGGIYTGYFQDAPVASFFDCVVSNNAGPGVYSLSWPTLCKLTGCVIANNLGRGVISCSLYRCLVSGNSSTNLPGAGLADCYAENSLIISNRASGPTYGAIYSSTANASYLVNCTVAYNSAENANVCVSAGIVNCILWKNFGAGSESSLHDSIYNDRNCCRKGAYGFGSFTNDPIFIDPQNGDFRLQSNSPCINAGFNRAMTNSLDCAGNARLAGGTVDVGAYEYQTPTSLLSYVWAQTNGLPTDGSADFADTGGDGMNNYQESRAGTNPTNALSILAMQSPTSTNWTRAVRLSWQSIPGTFYSVERSSNAANGSFGIVRSNILGYSYSETTTFTDTDVSSGGPYFYRVGVQ